MSLPKKYVVQKSFRLDAKLEKDLEYLSDKLNRPQNELVNVALEDLMWENRQWFAEDVLIDSCCDYFVYDLPFSFCDISGVSVNIKKNDNGIATLSFCIKDDNDNIITEGIEDFPDSPKQKEDIKFYLRSMATMYLLPYPEKLDSMLKERLGYQ